LDLPEIVLVAAPEPAFRRSMEFALWSAGFRTSGHARAHGALSSATPRAGCAVLDDESVEDWPLLPVQVLGFARPVIMVMSGRRDLPGLPNVTLLMKPFLGEPLIEAVRRASGRRPPAT
jgi:FixJ family two-component response regulator